MTAAAPAPAAPVTIDRLDLLCRGLLDQVSAANNAVYAPAVLRELTAIRDELARLQAPASGARPPQA